MQILVMLLFLAVWLLILWSGSMALEATGMERTRARFQALSALSGTGFTTREAESIIEHPQRRRIVTYLIFLGNVGITAFIVLLVLYVRVGLRAPSILTIVLTAVVLLVVVLASWLGLIDRLTDALLTLLGRRRLESDIAVEEVFYQAGEYGVFRLSVGQRASIAGLRLKDIGLQERDVTILAIERGDNVLSHPRQEEELLARDYLLCYGKLAEVGSLKSQAPTSPP